MKILWFLKVFFLLELCTAEHAILDDEVDCKFRLESLTDSADYKDFFPTKWRSYDAPVYRAHSGQGDTYKPEDLYLIKLSYGSELKWQFTDFESIVHISAATQSLPFGIVEDDLAACPLNAVVQWNTTPNSYKLVKLSINIPALLQDGTVRWCMFLCLLVFTVEYYAVVHRSTLWYIRHYAVGHTVLCCCTVMHTVLCCGTYTML
eukprot:Lankesteria_metandrocarpae@DN2905_c0_g1_i2.p1